MALNVEMLKNPVVLGVTGVAVVGGIYLASKMRPKSDDSAPIEVPTAQYAVTAVGDTNQLDTMQRALADAEQKKKDLEDAAKETQAENERRLTDVLSGFQGERTAFEQRLSDERAQLGSQYGSQISSLQSTIDGLKAQIEALRNAPKPALPENASPQPQPQPQPGQTAPQQPSTPAQPEAPRDRIIYPGLGWYTMDCTGKPQVLLFSTFDAAVADQKTKGLSTTSLARNMTAIAVSGSTKWEVLGWDKLDNEYWRGWLNQTRAAWGLHPLTYDEIGRMQYQMRHLWSNADERLPVFQSLAYARALWEKWNLPYQCPRSTRRF